MPMQTATSNHCTGTGHWHNSSFFYQFSYFRTKTGSLPGDCWEQSDGPPRYWQANDLDLRERRQPASLKALELNYLNLSLSISKSRLPGRLASLSAAGGGKSAV